MKTQHHKYNRDELHRRAYEVLGSPPGAAFFDELDAHKSDILEAMTKHAEELSFDEIAELIAGPASFRQRVILEELAAEGKIARTAPDAGVWEWIGHAGRREFRNEDRFARCHILDKDNKTGPGFRAYRHDPYSVALQVFAPGPYEDQRVVCTSYMQADDLDNLIETLQRCRAELQDDPKHAQQQLAIGQALAGGV